MANVQITGINELKQILERVGKAPAKTLTLATKKAANIVKNSAKADSPKDTGKLRRSIKLKAEKRKTGKKVYQIKFIGEDLAKEGANGKRSFYPSSQEYGWQKQNGDRKEGIHFMKNAIQQNRRMIEQTMVDELANSLRSITR